MKKRLLGIALILSVSMLTGCSSLATGMQQAMSEGLEPVLSISDVPSDKEKNGLTWVELDQLTTFKSIRRTWDNEFGVYKFDLGSKNGMLYVTSDGSWSGNTTLYDAFQNKVFYNTYAEGSVRSELSKAAINEFKDVTSENVGILASINAYFNIIATNADETSGMSNIISRAEAMSAVYRAGEPVTYLEVPEDFVAVVGENVYNPYSYEMNQYSWLQYQDGSLNSTNYNSAMTCGEFIYMLVMKYFPEEYASVDINSTSFTDCVNGGNIAEKKGLSGHALNAYLLEYALQSEKGELPEELYRALVVANKKGIISSESEWKLPLYGGDVIKLIVNTYRAISGGETFLVNAKSGSNVGQSLYVPETIEVVEIETTSQELTVSTGTKLSPIADIDKLIDKYGDEINMTPEEIEEAKAIGDMYTIDELDVYLKVDYCKALNVRIGPSTDYKIDNCVPRGTKVHAVGICRENGWYRVIADGKIYYQCGTYFSEWK